MGKKSKAAALATRLPAGHPEGFFEALANLYARSGVGVDSTALQSAMTEGDPILSEACARAIGVMGGGHLSAGVSVQ